MSVDAPRDSRFSPKTRLTVYAACFVMCGLTYLGVLPAPVGILAAAVVPLVWAIEAYRQQSRASFLFAALVVFVALVPLLKHLR
ncbi:hypothetical protein P7D22_16835 [Lichenihabitans sp. Uapishka_5]|uniref:hypothetical protein n=1 Tax=Lichenihabitans sp. Uapishka_5 TaxID=3037302 RepID=UPI0029E7DC06|nr:hypothetical protein [Lichenihabitans sp. Uapishka_5]MDX7952836.1 hypothetical protein [Lichenihabitans sp. Uapishka_5]